MKGRLNVVLAGLLVLCAAAGYMVVRSVAPVADRWSYLILSPKDENLMDAMEVMGEAGYEVVSARRASDGGKYEPKMSYEMIFKRRGGADVAAARRAESVGRVGVVVSPK